MTAVKERILGAVSVMNDSDADIVWNFITGTFSGQSWDNIPEESPDEWDLKMLDSIKSDPDCSEFISEQELLKELNL